MLTSANITIIPGTGVASATVACSLTKFSPCHHKQQSLRWDLAFLSRTQRRFRRQLKMREKLLMQLVTEDMFSGEKVARIQVPQKLLRAKRPKNASMHSKKSQKTVSRS